MKNNDIYDCLARLGDSIDQMWLLNKHAQETFLNLPIN